MPPPGFLPIGVEKFERKWNSNENALFAFADDLDALAPGGFDLVFMARYTSQTDSFVLGTPSLSPVPTTQLIIARIAEGGVKVAVGATLPYTTTIEIFYNLGDVPFSVVTTSVIVDAGLPEGKELYAPTLPQGVLSITNASAVPSGKVDVVIDFYVPQQFVEDFENDWPPATPGMR